MSVVLINPFIVEPVHEAAFVDSWKQTAGVFANEPGYIDTRLHQSIDPKARYRFVNIAHWSSPEAWSAAMKIAPPKEGGEPGVQASPALYTLAPGGAVDARNASVEDEIRNLEQGLARAYRAADVSFLERVLADDYAVTDGPGTVSDKSKVLRDYRDGHLKVSDFEFDAMDVRPISSDAAIVSGQYHWTATYDSHPVPGAFRYLRVYSRDGEHGWRIRAGQVTPVLTRP